MYKVSIVERDGDTVFCGSSMFGSRAEAEKFFTVESRKAHVEDIRLFYCPPQGGEKELTRFVRHTKEEKEKKKSGF